MPRDSAIAVPAEKICAACNRPFAWRKKWEKVWADVRYCSEACRSGRYAAAKQRLDVSKKPPTP